uniref:Uncharacterized protein n=1 Tax=Physcomitrium patens TaxID=3218 RepID=A0A2K1IUZ8_PHYPA|nr:hypothetical protein PHYPA_025048 [Physcomitrium patens]
MHVAKVVVVGSDPPQGHVLSSGGGRIYVTLGVITSTGPCSADDQGKNPAARLSDFALLGKHRPSSLRHQLQRTHLPHHYSN